MPPVTGRPDEGRHLKEGTVTDHRLRRGIAVPNFGEEPDGLIGLGVAAEEAGFDGFFLWDHIVFSDHGDGPPIIDPWLALAVVAARTSRIKLGTMITPVPRRRPWQLARQTATLDRLSGGRVILGVGIGSPAYGDFGIFGEPTGDRDRADLLDEGLAVLDGLWSGERFSYAGQHFTVDPVRFTPVPVQRPRIPVWVGGVLPATRPMDRAARWDGAVPIRFADRSLIRPSAQDIAGVRQRVAAARGSADGFDVAVWAEVAPEPAAVPGLAAAYADAGATWWIETAKPGPAWWEGVTQRVAAGVLGNT
jgi:alkanesulfonate monooxygenase SsuD/methylene tetrahydromethanopterin reductase-like flavin-dependent oxidoreductase (luciferase family)